MALVAFRVQQRKPVGWVYNVVIIVSCAVLWALGVLGLVWAILLAVAALALASWADYRRLLRACREQVPPGTELSIGFGPSAMVVQGPTMTSRVDYAAFRQIQVRGGFVLLYGRRRDYLQLLPLALFEDEDISRIQGALRL